MMENSVNRNYFYNALQSVHEKFHNTKSSENLARHPLYPMCRCWFWVSSVYTKRGGGSIEYHKDSPPSFFVF